MNQITFPSWFKLERPLASLDIESTSTTGRVDAATDRIIDLAITKAMPDGTVTSASWRCNPGVPITPGSTECHGITDADVVGFPKLEAHRHEIMRALVGCDMVGYNLARYDVPLLYEELARNRVKWNVAEHRIFDAGVLMQRFEERTLSAAVRFYLGREHEGAHGAQADTEASLEVFVAQLARYGKLSEMTTDELAKFSTREEEGQPLKADLHGKFTRDKEGWLVFNFGKSQGKRIRDDLGYAHWMLSKAESFPAQTIAVLEAEIVQIDKIVSEQLDRQYASRGLAR